ncbi:cysteine protease [Maudiozyma exigua]|uniref:Cysteine protease RIM13 n=1 Tax=Maudiozyma exigua TaxID=34358 RepID=A0A9P6WD32_MAUEX|nr:cysteine protease [Kazachstania exigua]
MLYDEEINDILREAYVGKPDIMSGKLHLLIQKTRGSKDPVLLKKIIRLNDKVKNITDRERIEWLMSNAHNKFYPPLSIDDATDVPWNEPDKEVLKNGQSERLNKAYPNSSSLEDFCTSYTAMIPHLEGYVPIEQNENIGDCSLVASIINIKKAKLPMPPVTRISKDLYQVTLYFNGSQNRLVVVNSSRIPTNSHGTRLLTLRSSDLQDKIIEIACLDSLVGSYDTLGSNVVINTYMFTCFIPEIIPVEIMTFERFYKYFKCQICLMAIGTSEICKNQGNQSKLLSFHDYVIIDIEEETRLITLQDPLNSNLPLQFIFDDQFKKIFYQLYINWMPCKLFKSEKKLTFKYDSDECNKLDSIYGKPVFKVDNKTSKTQTVWLLLETHIVSHNKGKFAYIQTIPHGNFFSKPFPPKNSAVDICLQLLKTDIPSNSSEEFFVYSQHSAFFTLHAYSISPEIQLTKYKVQNSIEKFNFNWGTVQGTQSGDTDYLIGGRHFYLNPTFILEIQSDIDEETLFSLQTHSPISNELLNVQLYNLNDANLTNPILSTSEYSSNVFSIFDTPLRTNNKYKLILSRYGKTARDGTYTILMKTRQKSSNCHIDIQRIYSEFGGLAYHSKTTVSIAPNTTRFKLFLNNSERTNELYVRLRPVENNGKATRCNVFDEESHDCLYYDEKFYKGTFVAPHIQVKSDCNSIALLIELEEVVNRELKYDVFIGSKWRIAIDDRF